MTAQHLWEIDHPYYGAEGDHAEEFETLDELIDNANDWDADLNHIYRWDWDRPDQLGYNDGEEDSGRGLLTLYVVLPRKSRFIQWSAQVTEADEPKIREFLTSDRVLGALKTMWEPFL